MLKKKAIQVRIAIIGSDSMNYYFFKNIGLTFEAFGPSE